MIHLLLGRIAFRDSGRRVKKGRSREVPIETRSAAQPASHDVSRGLGAQAYMYPHIIFLSAVTAPWWYRLSYVYQTDCTCVICCGPFTTVPDVFHFRHSVATPYRSCTSNKHPLNSDNSISASTRSSSYMSQDNSPLRPTCVPSCYPFDSIRCVTVERGSSVHAILSHMFRITRDTSHQSFAASSWPAP